MPEVLVIQMQTRDGICIGCGGPCGAGLHQSYGLPYFEGQIVPNDWTGEWGGHACCFDCYQDHLLGRGRFTGEGPWPAK